MEVRGCATQVGTRAAKADMAVWPNNVLGGVLHTKLAQRLPIGIDEGLLRVVATQMSDLQGLRETTEEQCDLAPIPPGDRTTQ